MTLPEVLISVVLTAVLIAALSMSITVVLHQADNTEGRLNNARSEQSVSLWMPADLSSADAVSTDPAALPCTLPCPSSANLGGSNALMLTWTLDTLDAATGTTVTTTTKVSYRYMQMGTEWVMVRVECTVVGAGAATCQSNTVLHNLDAPPAGQTFVPGVSTPTWVIQVSQALDPAATGAPGETIPVDPNLKNKNGQRVVVTINGGGDAAGAGGGTNQISLSAGGTERKQNLATSDPSGVPPFVAARSRCGGNFGLIVDTSGSIGAAAMGASILSTPNWATVRGSIYKFIEAFEGTPVTLEVVAFSTTASVLGAAAGTQKYYDMLDPAQVAALKTLVGYPNTAGGLQSGGSTNWEDAFYTLFNKPDGTVQPILPKAVIFFTDGVPTNSRLQTATPAPAMDPRDAPLPGPNSTWYQVGWNRANRVMRQFDADVESLIGMYVGSSTATSGWQDTQGYHLTNWQRGYHNAVERANTIAFERGYHNDYQRGNNVVFERGYHTTYDRNNNVQFQYATTGVAFEKKGNGNTWSSVSAANYFQNNTTPDSLDGWRVRVTGTPGTWSSTNPYTSTAITQAVYDLSNSTTDGSEGFRTIVSGGLSSSWTSVTAAQYTGSNTTADSSDGWRTSGNLYSAPFDTWESTTQAAYDAANTTTDATDGWRTRQTAQSTAWTSVTLAQYNASNTTSDNTDGWQIAKAYSSPFDQWEATTATTYNTTGNNSAPGETDGWRARLTGPPTSWTSITQTEYDKTNQTPDESDGYRTSVSYTSPYSLWEPTTEATYNSNNTTSDATDGWKADKVYAEPFTAYEVKPAVNTLDKDILGRFIQPVGTPVGPILDASGNVTNAETANLYSLSNYAALNSAMQAIALSECGGTLTIQTRLPSTNGSAQDPFTYQNSVDQKIVTTTSQFRGGTFDFQTTSSVNPTITLQNTSDLTHYSPVSWSCTAKGQTRSFTTTPISGTPWSSITVNVAANEAVSCTQYVQWTP